MRSSQKQTEREQQSEFATLRTQYHSLHAREREDVIRLLGDMSEPEAARELIDLYRECLWRSTRLQILNALSRNPSSRSLQFLFKVAQETDDIPLAEAAIHSLGQTHHPLAARFLNHYFSVCAESLKPSVAGAIGLLPDRTIADQLTQDLTVAIENRNLSLIRNLVLTLGELKIREAIPQLESLIEGFSHRPIVLSALVALGKISRSPGTLEKLERRFSGDLFEYQIFTAARNQIQFRSQWKLEDYLSRIFKSDSFHPALPYELTHFDPKDVREGFRLFTAEVGTFERLCLALSRLHFADLSEWYEEFCTPNLTNSESSLQVLESLSHHSDSALIPFLRKIEGREPQVQEKWLETLALLHPEADRVFAEYVKGERSPKMETEERIRLIGHLENFALCHPGKFSRQQQVMRVLEACLEDETKPESVARALRALGNLEMDSPKAFGFVRKHIANPAYTDSVLSFLRHCPEKDSQSILLAQNPPLKIEHDLGLLRALRAQRELPTQNSTIDAVLKRNLANSAPASCKREALGLLTDHPALGHLDLVHAALQGERSIQMAAIVTLSKLGNEQTADELAAFLNSPPGTAPDESLIGRTLDTLTHLPGLRACRVTMDYLKDHATDDEVCEKISRCLNPPPGTASDYFVKILDEILHNRPDHPHADAILALRTRFTEASPKTLGSPQPRGPDIAALDRELQKTLPRYEELDEAARSALRAAETPFLHPEMFDENVDKSPCVLEYCKALDIVLERSLGRKHLFPRLETQIHDFQNLIHAAHLNEPYPEADQVIRAIAAEKHFTAQSFPLHKMAQLSQSILSGKILNDRSRTLDGLRAWAIILLLFARKNTTGPKPLIPVQSVSDEEIVRTARRLIGLQDIRNPAAHRQTHTQFPAISEVRSETLQLLNLFQKMF